MAEQATATPPTFLTLREYIARIPCHYSTAVRAARSGEIPAILRHGQWFIPATYVESLESEAFARFTSTTATPAPEAPRHDPVAAAKAAVRQHVRTGGQ